MSVGAPADAIVDAAVALVHGWPTEYYVALVVVVVTVVVVLGLLLAEFVYLRGDEYHLAATVVDSPPADASVVAATDDRVAGFETLREVVEGATGSTDQQSVDVGPMGYAHARRRLEQLPLVDAGDEDHLYVETDRGVVRVSIRETERDGFGVGAEE